MDVSVIQKQGKSNTISGSVILSSYFGRRISGDQSGLIAAGTAPTRAGYSHEIEGPGKHIPDASISGGPSPKAGAQDDSV
ncbi:MAG TPA: hypothetical protein VJR04_03115 [Terriglobales bacterium]|nr:hypothetical protein [Terriglobales bacterium]